MREFVTDWLFLLIMLVFAADPIDLKMKFKRERLDWSLFGYVWEDYEGSQDQGELLVTIFVITADW